MIVRTAYRDHAACVGKGTPRGSGFEGKTVSAAVTGTTATGNDNASELSAAPRGPGTTRASSTVVITCWTSGVDDCTGVGHLTPSVSWLQGNTVPALVVRSTADRYLDTSARGGAPGEPAGTNTVPASVVVVWTNSGYKSAGVVQVAPRKASDEGCTVTATVVCCTAAWGLHASVLSTAPLE